jgi:putative multiple sugar transport system permease protein
MADSTQVHTAAHAATTTDIAPGKKRFAAWAIDAGLALGLVVLAIAVYYLGYRSGSLSTYYIALVVSIVALVTLAGLLVYQILLLGNSGYTIGKQTMGLRALSVSTGMPVGWQNALKRMLVVWAFSLIPVIGTILVHASVLFDSTKRGRGWHDQVAGTIVYDVRQGLDPAEATHPTRTLRERGGPLSHVLTDLSRNGIFLALVGIILLFTILTNGILIYPQNVSNLIVQNGYILILAVGMVMVIIAGHIDLSVGSVAAFTGALSGVFVVRLGLDWWLGILLTLLVGAIVGAWQGFWIAFVKIPAFIVTLAGMLIFRGLTLIVLASSNIGSFPADFRAIGNGFVPIVEVGSLDVITLSIAGLALTAMIVQQARARSARKGFGQAVEPSVWFFGKLVLAVVGVGLFALALASYKGIPITLIVLGLLIVIYSTVTNRAVFGRHVYAIGGNRHAAELSGIKTLKVDFLLFVNMGVLAALAGVVFTARLNLAGPAAGQGFELEAISAAFIGGAAVQGGVGTVVGAITGGLIIGVINNGMSILGVGPDWQQAIKGFVLLLAVAFDVYNKRRAGGR